MRVLIDADGCPVVNITIRLCRQYAIPCLIFCDTAHEFRHDGVTVYTVDKWADSVDFTLVNRLEPGDLVITQDYGLASMCLARSVRVLHQDGMEYTPWNIDALLLQRHEAKRFRMSGGRVKGPSKRTTQQNRTFALALEQMLRPQN